MSEPTDMSKAYPSTLSREEYKLLSDLLPAAKPGGRPRQVDLWEVLNAIFSVLVDGVRWRALPGDVPPWQPSIPIVATGAKTGPGLKFMTNCAGLPGLNKTAIPTHRKAAFPRYLGRAKECRLEALPLI